MAPTCDKSRLEVWKYFERCEENGQTKTKCVLCGTKLAYNNGISTMRNHLSGRHKSVKLGQDVTHSNVKRQTTLFEHSRSVAKLTKAKVESLNKDLDLMCALDLRPAGIVEGRGLKNVCII